jgi:hypothetical protein
VAPQHVTAIPCNAVIIPNMSDVICVSPGKLRSSTHACRNQDSCPSRLNVELHTSFARVEHTLHEGVCLLRPPVNP